VSSPEATIGPDAQQPTVTNDAFISYSRKDEQFAAQLEKALKGYKPPGDLNLPQRYLTIFRDKEDFTGVKYHQSLEKYLKGSAKMILICSPNSCKSIYVDDEVKHFIDLHGAENIIPILHSGIPNNEAKPGQEDEKCFPQALMEALGAAEMPLAVDYKGFSPEKDKVDKGVHYGPWYTLLANLYGVSRAEIEQRDKNRTRKRRIVLGAIAGGVFVALLVAFFVTYRSLKQTEEARTAEKTQRINAEKSATEAREQRHEAGRQRNGADRERDEAERQRDKAELQTKKAIAEKLATDSMRLLDRDVQSSLLLAVASLKISPVGGGRRALQRALSWNPSLDQIRRYSVEGASLRSISPDGKLAVFVREFSEVLIIDVKTWRQIVEPFSPHPGAEVGAIAFSPDGKFLVSIGRERPSLAPSETTKNEEPSIMIWDVMQRKARRLPCNKYQKNFQPLPAFNPREPQFALAMSETIEFWNLEMGIRMGDPIILEKGRVSEMCFSPAGDILVIGDYDGRVSFWDTKTKKPLAPATSAHRPGAVSSLSFRPDGKYLASAGIDNRIVFWDVQSRTASGEIKHPGAISVARWAKIPITGGADGTVRLWEFNSESSYDGTKREVKLSAEVSVELRGLNSPVVDVKKEVDLNKELLEFNLSARSTDGVVAHWNAARPENIASFWAVKTKVDHAIFSPDGKTIAITNDTGGLVLFPACAFDSDSRKGGPCFEEKILSSEQGWEKPIFSPDGKRIIAKDRHGSIWVWEVDKTHRGGAKLLDSSKSSGAGLFAWNGRTFVLGESELRLWNDIHRETFSELEAPIERYLAALALSPDGKLVAASYLHDSNVWLWSPFNGKWRAKKIGRHAFGVNAVSFHPKGLLLASAGGDQCVRFWNVLSGKEDGFPLQHGVSVRALAFTKDGATLATATRTGYIQLWDVARRIPITDPLAAYTRKSNIGIRDIRIAISPDGSRLLSSVSTGNSSSDNVLLWKFDIEEWMSRACRMAGRNLTNREWNEFTDNTLPYEKACPNF
jgi:WD40 repeat protein